MLKNILTIIVIIGLLAGTGLGQQPGFDPFKSRSEKTRIQSSNVISSMQFVDAPITDIFTMISDLTGWSIIMSPEVSAKPPRINIWVKNLVPEQVLEQVVSLAGLILEQNGTTIKVMAFSEYARIHGVEKKVLPLKFADARELVDILKPFAEKNDQSKILADQGGNKIVLLVPKPLLESMERLVTMLDTPFKEDEVTIVPLKHLEASEIATALEDLLTGSSNRRTGIASKNKMGTTTKSEGVEFTRAGESWIVQFMVEPKLNVIVLRGHPKDVSRTVDLIKDLDVPPDIETIGYELKFTTVRDVFSTLKEIIRVEEQQRGRTRYTGLPRLRIAASEQNNRIIVEGSPEDHTRIAKVIAAIDKPLAAGSGGMRVHRLENASSSEVVKVLQDIITAREQLATQEGHAGPGSMQEGIHRSSPGTTPNVSPQPPTPSSPSRRQEGNQTTTGDVIPALITEAPEINAVIIRASAVEQEEFAEVIRELDKPRDQVVLEVTLVGVRSSGGFDLGIELSGVRIGNYDTTMIGFSHFGIGTVDSTSGNVRLPTETDFGVNLAIFNSGDFSFVLNALETVGDTRITSSPKILIEDNALAQLSQLNQEPFETSSQGETSTITSFGGFVDAGTVLNIIPHVSEQNWLRLEYEIQQSSFSSRTAEQLAANLPPPRQQNIIRGTVRVPAGHIIALGGLVSTRNDEVTDMVPFLSEIPILGELFKNRSHSKTDDTLFVFIKPVILRDPKFKDLLYLSEQELRKAKLSHATDLQNPMKMLTPLLH